MITEVEFDDAVMWEAVEDAVNDAAKEVVDNCAWDAVEDQVREQAEQAAQDYCEYNIEIPVVHDEVESLLREFKGRLTAGDKLCGIGTLAKEVIELVAQPLVAEPFPVVDRERIDGDLDVQHRLADLERQVKVLLSSIADLGERAASVTPNG